MSLFSNSSRFSVELKSNVPWVLGFPFCKVSIVEIKLWVLVQIDWWDRVWISTDFLCFSMWVSSLLHFFIRVWKIAVNLPVSA